MLASLSLALTLAPGTGAGGIGEGGLSGIRPELGSHGTVPVEVGGRRVHPQRLVVQASRETFDRLAASGFRLRRYFPQIGWGVVERRTRSLARAHRVLRDTPGVARVEFDRTAVPAYTPNDSNWSNQWSMRRLNLEAAWDRHLGGPDGVVAVMDTGVNTAHEDLVANLWTNANEIAGNGIDDDANGYVDDIYGYDFVGEDAIPNDVHGHGTACAGLAAAVGNNSLGVTGAAPRGRIMSLKSAQDDGYFYLSNNLPSYLYAADNGARVLSMSFYSDSLSEAERDAIEYLASRNVVLVAAAGNDSTVYPFYPAAYERTISVAATTNTADNQKAGFSDWGSWVDVAAPGVSCATTVTGGGYTNGFSGTSAACPHVAGVAALLIGADPARTAQEVRNAIEDTARPLVQAPFGEYTNYGLVDADAALRSLLDGPTAPRRAPRMLWASPIGTSSSGKTMRLEGRTLDPVGTRVLAGRNRLATTSFHRDRRDVTLNPTSRSFVVQSWQFGALLEVRSPEPSG
ncbi:MAG: S8 family peptidase, partial [Fimbriimonadaceae bacterium]|nr:S8 family peptidase [Fimbriimonadaceae bacterium]